jgi:ferredoxin--NADP+ reductase
MTITGRTAQRDPGPPLPEVKMHLHSPAEPGIAVVVANEICTGPKASGIIRHLALDVSGTRLAGAFRAGQSFGVIPPGADEHGRPHKLRLYSIASPTAGEDGRGQVLSTTVKRLVGEHWETHRLFTGVSSNFLCDLAVGDRVTVTGPSGKRFLLPSRPEDHDYLFMATGTGIAPFRGMVKELLAAKVRSRIVLVMGSPYRSDLPYHAEFEALEGLHPEFTYLTALSREPQEDGGPRMYVQDRLGRDAATLAPLLASERSLVYICGVAGMELGIFQQLARLLPAPQVAQYLRIDPAVEADIASWTRRMVQREVQPTRRVFLEVY